MLDGLSTPAATREPRDSDGQRCGVGVEDVEAPRTTTVTIPPNPPAI